MKRNMQILGFCMLFVILLLSGCSLMPANTGVLIGTNLALSGKGMSYSTSTERGIELAKDMVNDRGGLLGKPVQLVSVDNHGKPEDAVAAIQQLTVRHVSAIIGPDLADCTRAVIPNVEAVKIPLISPPAHSRISPSMPSPMRCTAIFSAPLISMLPRGGPWPTMR